MKNVLIDFCSLSILNICNMIGDRFHKHYDPKTVIFAPFFSLQFSNPKICSSINEHRIWLIRNKMNIKSNINNVAIDVIDWYNDLQNKSHTNLQGETVIRANFRRNYLNSRSVLLHIYEFICNGFPLPTLWRPREILRHDDLQRFRSPWSAFSNLITPSRYLLHTPPWIIIHKLRRRFQSKRFTSNEDVADFDCENQTR